MRFAILRTQSPAIARVANIVVGMVLIATVLAPLAWAERLPVTTFTVADGALRDEVAKIRQDSRGFLWLCSAEGLSRFDGDAFTNFTTADGLPDRHVNDFLESKDGVLWVATDGGLVRMNPTGIPGSNETPLFTVIRSTNDTVNAVTTLEETNDGRIWVGTTKGLFILRGQEKLEAFDLGALRLGAGFASVSSILTDRQGNTWVGTNNAGLYRVAADGLVENFGMEHGLPGESFASLMQDRSGRIWLGMRSSLIGYLARLASTTADRFLVERVFEWKGRVRGGWVPALYESASGDVWIGTTGGLCRINSGDELECNGYRAANNLCDEEINSILDDKDGNLWVASRCGTKKWSRYGLTSYFTADGLASPSVNSIFENSAGDLFVTSNASRRAVSRFDGTKFSSTTPAFPADVDQFGWGWKQTVIQDSEKDWWFPTATGIYKFPASNDLSDLSRARPVKILLGGKDPEIFRMYEDSRKDVWVGTWAERKELWRWERRTNRWFDHTSEAGIVGPTIDITAFVEDASGSLWIGTGSDYENTSLIRYREGRFETFSRADNELIAGWLRDLYVDAMGRLWIASTTSGLLRLDDVNAAKPELVQYTAANGLSSNGIYCITEDEYGRIYAGSARGLDRLDPSTGEVVSLTTKDGLPSALVEVAYRDSRGDLWFGTQNGLARLVPEPRRSREPPKAFISGIQVSGVPRSVSIFGETDVPAFDLKAGEQHVTLDFFGVGANIGEKLRFEYRFGGSDWIPTVEHSLNFAGLSAGRYLIEVRSITADGLTSQPATAAFTIASPIWQRWWFVMTAVLIVTGLVYGAYRLRLTRLLEIERTRTRIATDLHDDIGSNLSTISLLSEIVGIQMGNGESKRMLATIADMSRSSVDSMRDIVWSINPDRDSFLEMTRRMREHAENTCVPNDILLTFAPDDKSQDAKLSMEVRRELFLIFKEAVSNAVRHSRCSTLRIDFRISRSEIFLNIVDNGQGFDVSTVSKGNGLESMQHRAERLGGRLEVGAAPDGGTSLRVRIPS